MDSHEKPKGPPLRDWREPSPDFEMCLIALAILALVLLLPHTR